MEENREIPALEEDGLSLLELLDIFSDEFNDEPEEPQIREEIQAPSSPVQVADTPAPEQEKAADDMPMDMELRQELPQIARSRRDFGKYMRKVAPAGGSCRSRRSDSMALIPKSGRSNGRLPIGEPRAASRHSLSASKNTATASASRPKKESSPVPASARNRGALRLTERSRCPKMLFSRQSPSHCRLSLTPSEAPVKETRRFRTPAVRLSVAASSNSKEPTALRRSSSVSRAVLTSRRPHRSAFSLDSMMSMEISAKKGKWKL